MDDVEVLSVISQINEDFTEGKPPFDNVEFPESRLVREIKEQAGDTSNFTHLTMEDRARLATIFSTLDYNRDANQLVDKLLELHKGWPHLFEPQKVHSKKEVEHAFEKVSFRYGNRDANGWYKNCQILNEKYNGRVTELILYTGCDAVALVERLNEDGFLYLKGQKIAPMYARILSDEVAELDNLWKLEIPVDIHIRRLTQDLTNAEMDDDDIRRWWRNVGPAAGIDRHSIDGGLWLIGNNWESWGKDYWEEVTSE